MGGPEVSGLGHWDKGIAVVSHDSGYNSDDGDEFHNGDGDRRDDRGLDGGGVLRRRVAQLLLPRPILHVSATVQFASIHISYGRVALKRFSTGIREVAGHSPLCGSPTPRTLHGIPQPCGIPQPRGIPHMVYHMA